MRCAWAEQSDAERVYHDTEWGLPIHDDRKLFELITLRGAAAGLTWRTVLAKRERYRRVFHDYDLARIAAMTDDDLAVVRRDRGIIRHRLKIASVRGNARAGLRLIESEGSLFTFLCAFLDSESARIAPRTAFGMRARSDESDVMSAILYKRGFRFAGTAICYAVMQATGMVDGHETGCQHRACR
ncbi:DNA-3-methyladenine glycosylase I [Luteibacter sp. OK325]|uniref:DNA-3-methyladenine glycosylase I n=1 Tax=Luteibacter sp. OK325 TaxID=2135670 RepID=UPI000D36C002|nr:DNA-3-methyladenine glycosylase I [Luteibacter sp. OK325]PTR27242.1 DNA-3-methyladenine glycosylase I [Luteibacter sp. OK325]